MRQRPDRALLAGGIAMGLIAIAVLVLLVPAWLVPGSVTPAQSEALQARNDLRTTLLQGIGGLFLISGVVATWRQVQLTRHQLDILREGQITERFTRAIEQLGSDNLDVRLGGIYALERIASSSEDDRGPILEVLTAYVRGHSPWPAAGWEYGAATPPEPEDRQLASLQFRKPDVQAVVNILGRRKVVDDDEELLLARVDLRRAYLRRANLEHANLRNASLRGVQGRNARLRGAVLKQADLTKALLDGADLQAADLQRANLTGANLTGANLSGADLHGAALDGAVLRGIVTDESTRWPEGFTPPGA
jgi:Pentapeptide repeats (8 copies)